MSLLTNDCEELILLLTHFCKLCSAASRGDVHFVMRSQLKVHF